MVFPTAAQNEELIADFEHQILSSRPEKILSNDYALIMTVIEKLATGAAYLALTWSTVVLLGGFISDLKYEDFWYLTTISMVFAIGILSVMEYPADAFPSSVRCYVTLHDKLEVWQQRYAHRFPILCVKLLSACLGAFSAMVWLIVFAALPILFSGPAISMAISMMRLVQKDYGGGANKEKLTAAMDIFYSLAVIHGLLLYLRSLFPVIDGCFAESISRKCGFGPWGFGVVRKYIRETRALCSKDGRLHGERNLITYAVGLLEITHGTPDEYLGGARILDTFVRDKIPIEDAVSKLAIQNLIQVLGWRNQRQEGREVKERAARIVTHLSSNLHTDEFPGALQCIASLLETPQPNIQTQAATRKRKGKGPVYWIVLSSERDRNKDDISHTAAYTPTEELVLQGLLLLERLTQHQDNCKEICENERLLSMIMSPLSWLSSIDHDAEILIGTLRVVTGLVSAPGESTGKLRHEISSNSILVADMQRVLEDDNAAPGLKTATIEILMVLASDLSMSHASRERFILVTKNIFLGDMARSSNQADQETREASCRLMKTAGEALVKMLSVWGVTSSNVFMSMLPQDNPSGICSTDKLTEILAEAKLYRQCQTSAAQILEHFCLQWTEQKMISLLETALALILRSQTKANDEAVASPKSTPAVEALENQPRGAAGPNKPSSEHNDDQYAERKLLASLLSLTVTIWDNLLQKDNFFSLASADDNLVKKLKEIVARNNDATTDCLRVVKLTCQVVIVMVRHKPSWIKCFEECDFTESLSEALKTMRDVDKCMFFAAGGRETMKPARPLSSLVKEARQFLEKEEPPQSVRINVS